jgi:hypothetical protein
MSLLLLLMAIADAKQPHVIQIVMDDVGHNDIGYANPRILSPKIDALRNEGVTLDRFYAFKEVPSIKLHTALNCIICV